jgi:membrane-associated phospholipid phosphatase
LFKLGATRGGVLGLLGAAIIFTAPPVRAGEALTTYGDIAQLAIPAIAVSVTALKSDFDGLLQFGATSAVTMGTTVALKNGINRERPNGGDKSFPSGHAASAFMGASFLHYRYGWEYGLPAYVAAAGVAYSRVDADKHFWTDVIGSAVIANVSAYVLTDTLNENVSIVPFTDIGKKNFGLIAKIRF